MALFEEVVLWDSIAVKTSPEKVFNFLTRIVDDDSYRAWHKADHVSLRWLKGHPWTEGSVLYAEEYIHGKLHKLKFRITRIVPNKRIEYSPTSRFIRKFFQKTSSSLSQRGNPAYLQPQARIAWVRSGKCSLANG